MKPHRVILTLETPDGRRDETCSFEFDDRDEAISFITSLEGDAELKKEVWDTFPAGETRSRSAVKRITAMKGK